MNKVFVDNIAVNKVFAVTEYFNIYMGENKKLYKIHRDYNSNIVNFSIYEEMFEYFNSVKDKTDSISIPTGLIYKDNRVVGYEMDYLEDYVSLSLDSIDLKALVNIQLRIVNLLESLFKAGIVYFDINIENFLINHESNDIKLVDFDPVVVKYGELTERDYKKLMMFISMNFSLMLSKILDDQVRISFNSFEEVTEYLNNKILEFDDNLSK